MTDLGQAAKEYQRDHDNDTTVGEREAFIAGAEWQKEELKDIHADIIKFLDLIDSSTGEIITEYHWREACGLIKYLKDKI